MLQESLLNLRQRVEALFRDKGYKEACIKRYNQTWDHLRDYMTEHDLVLYTSEIGESFLAARYGEKSFANLTHRQQECVRHIDVLTYMLENDGVMHTRRSQVNKYVFSGTTGLWFNNFLSGETEYKRSSSISRYQERLHNLYRYLIGQKTEIEDITPSFMSEYIAHLDFVKSGPDRDNIVMTTRIFFRYLCSKQALRDNRQEIWMSLMRLKGAARGSHRIPSVYTAEEVERIIAAIDRSSNQGKRDYAMTLLAARYGLRASDIVGLRFINLDWDHDRISIIQKKTEKRVLLPLSEEVGTAIIEYIRYARPAVDHPCVFISAQAPFKPLSYSVMASFLQKYMLRAGIDSTNKKKGPHALRHSLATNLLGVNTSLPVISEILGHSSTESTKTYLRVNMDLLRQCALDVPFVPSSFYENLYGQS